MEEFRIFLLYKTCSRDEKAHARIATGHSRNNIQDGGILVWDHLAKIKVDFFETKLPVFVIVINTSCSCIVAWFTPAKNSINNTLKPNATLVLFWIFGGRKSDNNPLAFGIYSNRRASAHHWVVYLYTDVCLVFTCHLLGELRHITELYVCMY